MAKYRVDTDQGSYMVETDDAPAAPAGAPNAAAQMQAAALAKIPHELRGFTSAEEAAPGGFINPRTGQRSTIGGDLARVPILDAPAAGISDIGAGVAHMAEPGLRAKAGGASQVLHGAMQVASPLMAGSGIVAPLATGAAVLSGSAAQGAVTGGLQALGAPDEYANLAGDLAGLEGGRRGVELPAAAARAAASIPRPGFRPQLDPTEAAAVEYGRQNGVQMSTSTLTGSKVAKNAENVAQNLPLTASVAKAARAKEQSTLAAAGAREVDQLGATPGAPVPSMLEAGEAIHSKLKQLETTHNQNAGDSYDLLRSIEAQPEFKATLQTGTKRVDGGLDDAGNPTFKTVPKMEDIQLPVDRRGAKAALRPMYDRMLRTMPVTQQQASYGLKALENVVNGPDFESASITDEDLGAIKALVREGNGSPQAQGLAKQAISKLSAATDAAVARAGPDAVAALKAGRESTIAKYAASDLRDELPAGAVDAAKKLAAPEDKNIDLLRRVAAHAPDEVKGIAQAKIQSLLDQATADAGMNREFAALKQYNAQGAETKKLLYGDSSERLGNFFTLAKKMAENPNPSGSAQVLTFAKGVGMLVTSPHLAVPYVIAAKPLARMLFEPTAGRNLIAGMRTAAGAKGAGLLAQNILSAAGPEAVPATSSGVLPKAGAATPSSVNGPVGGTTGGAVSPPSTAGVAGNGSAPAPAAGAGSAGGGLRSGGVVVPVPGESGQGYTASYRLRELADLQASHNGNTFAPNGKYPHENQRDYANAVNQSKIVSGASRSEFNPAFHITDNPDASNGPMITDSAGNVLGGNGRKMILDRVYAGNPKGAAAYRAMLAEKAGQFGIDPAEVAKFKQPVLTRELPDSEFTGGRSKQGAIADFNKKGTAELTPSERAISDSRRVSTATLDDIAARLDQKGANATVADVLEGKAGGEVLQKLVGDGVVSPQERAAFVAEGGALTPAGRARISQLMIGRFFRDPAQLDAMAPEIRNRIERIAAPLAQVEAKPDWSITPAVQDALELIERARQLGHKNVDDFIRNEGLFADQNYSPKAIALAKAIKGDSAALTAAARQYAHDAAFAAQGPSMFGDAPTPASAFADAFEKASAPAPDKAPANALAAPSAPEKAPANALAPKKRTPSKK